MLLRFDLRAWEVQSREGEPIDCVICSTPEEAAEIANRVTGLEEFTLIPINPLTGGPIEEA